MRRVLNTFVIGVLWLLCSCATPRSLEAYWKRVNPSDFPIPEATPYDENPQLRLAYRCGFEIGIRSGIISLRRGEWRIGDTVSDANCSRADAWDDGFRDAGIALLNKNSEFIILLWDIIEDDTEALASGEASGAGTKNGVCSQNQESEPDAVGVTEREDNGDKP